MNIRLINRWLLLFAFCLTGCFSIPACVVAELVGESYSLGVVGFDDAFNGGYLNQQGTFSSLVFDGSGVAKVIGNNTFGQQGGGGELLDEFAVTESFEVFGGTVGEIFIDVVSRSKTSGQLTNWIADGETVDNGGFFAETAAQIGVQQGGVDRLNVVGFAELNFSEFKLVGTDGQAYGSFSLPEPELNGRLGGAAGVFLAADIATFQLAAGVELAGYQFHYIYTFSDSPLPGDFDFDGDVDLDDVDFYAGQIGVTSSDAGFNAALDLNQDDAITLSDHDLHVTTLLQLGSAAGALIGDLNLDGDVDVSQIVVGNGVSNVGDASVLLANLNTANGASYALGDLNADGDVDVSQIVVVAGQAINVGDASRLLVNLGRSNSSPVATAVPEPSSLCVSVMFLGLFGANTRWKR